MKKSEKKLQMLTECSVMLALSTVLSFVKIWQMPMGGGVTLLSMLPVMLIAVKYGLKGGLPTCFAFSLFQTAIGLASGNVFVWCTKPSAFIVCLLFDYLFPFTGLGLAGMFGKNGLMKNKSLSVKKNYAFLLLGFVFVICLRFICHFITGFTIWGQWAEDGQSPYIYSLLYNGQYMLPELVLTVVMGGGLLKIQPIKKVLNLV